MKRLIVSAVLLLAPLAAHAACSSTDFAIQDFKMKASGSGSGVRLSLSGQLVNHCAEAATAQVKIEAKDADVAWICSMIPHHQGAIDMARAGLKGADNAESKKLAEETIESNERELKKLVAWVEKNARKENKDEATGSTK